MLALWQPKLDYDLSVAFENRETDDCLVVGAENLISAWTEGVAD